MATPLDNLVDRSEQSFIFHVLKKNYFQLGDNCLNIVFASALQKSESALSTHVSPPSLHTPVPPLPRVVRAPGWGPCVICDIYSNFSLASYFTHGDVNVSVPPTL